MPAQPGGSLLSFPIPLTPPIPRRHATSQQNVLSTICLIVRSENVKKKKKKKRNGSSHHTAATSPVAAWNASCFISQINNFTPHQAQCKHGSWRTTVHAPPRPSQFVFFPPVPSYVWQSEPLTRHSDSTEMRLVHGSLHRTPPIPSATIRPRRPPHHRWKLINVSGLLWVLYSGTAAV